jgi:hypothetical protein
MTTPLRVVLLKPSKYDDQGNVARFRFGFMPNATLSHIGGMTPNEVGGHPVELHMIDEYVEPSLEYLNLLHSDPRCETLVAFVGVMSSQYHRALDLAAYAMKHGVRHIVLGGSHAMTCDTKEQQKRGVSFALAEAEVVWEEILRDTVSGQLSPVYGMDERWASELPPVVIKPQDKAQLSRYAMGMQGIYPARGCPYRCTFCSIIKIAGNKIRYQPLEATLHSLRVAKSAGAGLIMFTSDNFNKYTLAEQLLEALVEEQLKLPFLVQCDAMVARDERFVEMLGKAGCVQIFIGVESFKRDTLKAAHKGHNDPNQYVEIVRLCDHYGIASHFSNIIAFEQDEAQDVRNHLEKLLAINPDFASFYIMVPIPGTEQYDDFRKRNLITENNIDRISSDSLTWQHPSIRKNEAHDLLFDCYRSFYSAKRLPRNLARFLRKMKHQPMSVKHMYPATWISARLSIARRVHPMSGGIIARRFDRSSDYADLRREYFGVDLVPLPTSLPTPDQQDFSMHGHTLSDAATRHRPQAFVKNAASS